MSYSTTYPTHKCIYTIPDCIQKPNPSDPTSAFEQKTLTEILDAVNKNACFTASGSEYIYNDSSNCSNLIYDLSKISLSIKNTNDASYQNLLHLVNEVNTDLKILRKEDDPYLKKGIEEKQHDLNKSLIMNVIWTTLAVSTMYYVFRKI